MPGTAPALAPERIRAGRVTARRVPAGQGFDGCVAAQAPGCEREAPVATHGAAAA